MRRFGQAFIGTGLIGLLVVPVMSKAHTAGANFQSNVTAFELNHYPTTLNKQFSFDQSPVIADFAQAIQSNQADLQEVQMIEQRNKEIVQQHFDRWRNGTGNFFDLLAPNVTWTVTGTGVTAGTYRGRQVFLDQTVNPTSARLAKPITPTVRGIWADDDMVIALWDGEAIAKDGKPYRNTYTWIFRMQDSKAIEVIAFLDMRTFTDLWTRVSPTP